MTIPTPRSAVLLSLGALTGALAACGEVGTGPDAPPTAPAVTVTAEENAPDATVDAVPPPAETAADPAEPGICPTGDLDVSVVSQQGAAGSLLYTLGFRNISETGCELSGFPGVSLVGHGDGTQIGAPAVREGVVIAQMLPLAPGEALHADLRISRAEIHDPQVCGEVVEADGLRIYPPGNTESAFVPLEGVSGCSSEEVELLTVHPVVAP